MPSTYTTRNGLELQGSGENTNAWGVILNNRVFQLIDAMADGIATYTLSGTKTLTSTVAAANEARMRVQIISGGTGGTVTIPSVEKNYFVQNKATGDVVFTTGAGTTATIKPNSVSQVICDGTNVFLADQTTCSNTATLAYHIANKTYVDSAINNAVLSGAELPNQAGKDGFAFFSNGTAADFRQILISDVADLAAALAAIPNTEIGVKTDTATTTADAWVDTGVEVSITLERSTSRVRVDASVQGSSGGNAMLRLTRSGTPLLQGDAASSRTRAHAALSQVPSFVTALPSVSFSAIDTPASTGPHTYKVQWKSSSGYLNRSSGDTDDVATPRGVSTIIATELPA